MNIFLHEMKSHRKSLIIWCLGFLFMVAAGMGKFSAYSSSGQNMSELFNKMPKVLKVALGIGNFDLTKAIQFFGMLFLYLILMATIHAVMLGANIISKEERDKTSEFLFVKPVSRKKIITSKLVASVVNIVIINLVTFLSSLAIVGKYSKAVPYVRDIAVLMAGMLVTQLIFLFIGSGLAACSKNPKTATSAATGILLLTYFLYVVVDLNDKLGIFRYLTPFKYYEAASIVGGTAFEPVYLGLSAIIVTVMLYLTYAAFIKRDLKT